MLSNGCHIGCGMDWAFEDGYLVLDDWKTSKAIYSESTLQVQAYWTAFEEMVERGSIVLPEGVKDLPVKLRIVRFDKVKKFNPKTDIKEFRPSRINRDIFLGLLAYHNWSKNQK